MYNFVARTHFPNQNTCQNEVLLCVSETEDQDGFKVLFLEEELKEMKKALKDEKLKNAYLVQLLEQAQKLKVQPQ